jgi:hypothetical protein
MKSVRLDEALEARLKEAAHVSGEPVSNIIRQAIEERCTHILGERLAPRLADVIGVVHSQGGQARCTGKAFVENLRSRKRADR